MSLWTWLGFEKRALAALPPSQVGPLAEQVQRQARDLHESTVRLNRMISHREAQRRDPAH